MSDEPQCFTVSALKSRGWTDKLVRDLLEEPDLIRNRPYPMHSYRPLRLYLRARVDEVTGS
jgi:hypothetical protein